MERSYIEKLVYTQTEDGLSLTGVMMRPEPGPEKSVGVVWTHGFCVSYDLPQLADMYSLAERPDSRVTGLVIASPSIARHRAIKPDLIALAEKMVSEGRAQELLPWGSHVSIFGGLTVSAQTYLSWAGGKQDVFGVDSSDPAIAHITCPILAFYGTYNDVGGADDLETIRRNARLAPRVDTRLIEGAEDGYVGHESEVVEMISGWIGSRAPASSPTYT